MLVLCVTLEFQFALDERAKKEARKCCRLIIFNDFVIENPIIYAIFISTLEREREQRQYQLNEKPFELH